MSIKVLLVLESTFAGDRGFFLGIGQYSSLYGPWTFYKTAQLDIKRTKIEAIRNWGPDGVILSNEQCMLDEIAKIGVPVIVAAHNEPKREYKNVKYIDVRNDLVGEMGAEHFLKKGYKNFAFYSFVDYCWSREREEAFRKRVEASHYNVNTYQHRQSQQEIQKFEDTRQEDLMAWLAKLPKPVGLMACSDICARYVLDACRLQQLHVPEDIAVLGVENDEMLVKFCNPPLSSIELNFQQVGYYAAGLLHRVMMNESESDLHVVQIRPTTLEIRQSTEATAIDDEDIANALKYIRTHIRELIQVQDVVNATTLSRRTLYERFHKVMGHGVYTEIRNVRVEYIARMLIDTDASILDIARAFGYFGEENFARYFESVKGVSPRKYRSLHHK
jgi:LacI family transcriptional regulator